MKALAVAVATGLVALAVSSSEALQAQALTSRPVGPRTFPHTVPHSSGAGKSVIANETLSQVVKKTCTGCHSQQRKVGNLVLEGFDVAQAASNAELTEKIIGKLQVGMMPPPGRARPKGDTLQVLQATLERLVDTRAALKPEPGVRTFQRLNRAEYAQSIKQLLALDVDPGKWLPLDTKSANFDNIADVQMPSATTLDAYLDAASEISRLAVGDPKANPTSATYKIPRLASQVEHVEGAPAGTRGGTVVTHTFPADGEYVFALTLHNIPTGQLYGSAAPFDEKLEVALNGERVALLDIDRWMSQAPERDGDQDAADPRAGRAAAPLCRLRANVRGAGERPHRADRALDRRYADRCRWRDHDPAAPARRHGSRPVSSNGGIGDAVAPPDLLLPPVERRRGAAVRAEDPHVVRLGGLSPSAGGDRRAGAPQVL